MKKKAKRKSTAKRAPTRITRESVLTNLGPYHPMLELWDFAKGRWKITKDEYDLIRADRHRQMWPEDYKD
jgi:hypothetical protein